MSNKTPRTDALVLGDLKAPVEDAHDHLLDHARQLEGEVIERTEERDACLADVRQCEQLLLEARTCFENEKATSTHLETINVTLVREAIFTVLDEREWNFEDDEQRVDFADRVASFIPSESVPSDDTLPHIRARFEQWYAMTRPLFMDPAEKEEKVKHQLWTAWQVAHG